MRAPAVVERAGASIAGTRDRTLAAPTHDERTAAVLGLALGVSFTVCFLTGLLSHLIQHPAGWFHWPARPAGLYRITQGLHVATGLASIPLLLAKLWTVFPHLVEWPPVRSVAHVVERLMLVPLVAGSVFMLFSGAANIAQWYPWNFRFPVTHYWVAWITIGALITHIAAKVAVTRSALRRAGDDSQAPAVQAHDGLSRRGFLTWTAVASGVVTLTTIGQTVRPLRRFALFAPRRPDAGPQGLPVNATAGTDVQKAAHDAAYRLRITGDVPTPVELTIDELRALPRHDARLPISCVEGWSATADWRGVPVRDLLVLAGVDPGAEVEVRVDSLQRMSTYSHSTLNDAQARDRDTLIALELNGEELHIDHGFPCRLIGPNRPGVQQTKWVEELAVRRT
jgi:DMSO/TMAO reductase YedYZ molybdopterin-dependent catalytic subunit